MLRRGSAILALILLIAGVQGARWVHQSVSHGTGCEHHACSESRCSQHAAPDASPAGTEASSACSHGGAPAPDRPARNLPCDSGCPTCDLLALGTSAIADPPALLLTEHGSVVQAAIPERTISGLGVIESIRARPPPAA